MDIKDYFDWSPEKIQDFRDCLLAWYDQHGRDLPWRRTSDPYAIWVSEVMLQQTQVDTVIDYYQRFMQALPAVQALAQAPQEQLMSLWQGLGYYSRARNMQQAAVTVMSEYQGQMPKTLKELLTLKGIGPYTGAAIASIAFNQVEPAIDGNLMRVTARLFEIDQDIQKTATKRLFKEILDQLIDSNRPGDFNQALMDMGALVMTPSNPYPDPHPLADFDRSYQHKTAQLYPVKLKKTKQKQELKLAFYLVNEKGQMLVRQHQAGELLQGLWHFPMLNLKDIATLNQSTAIKGLALQQFFSQDQVAEWSNEAGILDKAKLLLELVQGPVKHVFSHRIWQIYLLPVVYPKQSEKLLEALWLMDDSFRFVDETAYAQLATSTLQKKLDQIRTKED